MICHSPLPKTKHAMRRQRQRSIPDSVIDAIYDFGEIRPAGHNAESFYFTKKTWRKFCLYAGPTAKGFERYRNCYFILGSDCTVVTAGFRH